MIGSDRGDLRVMIDNGLGDLPDGAEQVILWIMCGEWVIGCADGDRLCPWLRAVFTVTGCVHGYGLCSRLRAVFTDMGCADGYGLCWAMLGCTGYAWLCWLCLAVPAILGCARLC